MAAVVGFAFLWLSVTAVGKRVFLLVVATIPNAMHCMATTAATVKKRPLAVQKVRLSPVQKQLRIEAPPQTLLKAPPHPSPRRALKKSPIPCK